MSPNSKKKINAINLRITLKITRDVMRYSLAPVMCQRFVQCCQTKDGPSYTGTVIYQVSLKAVIGKGLFFNISCNLMI